VSSFAKRLEVDAARIHGDETTVLVMAKVLTSRLWPYVRDDRPLGTSSPRRRFQPSL
jgi:hypothetical protein